MNDTHKKRLEEITDKIDFDATHAPSELDMRFLLALIKHQDERIHKLRESLIFYVGNSEGAGREYSVWTDHVCDGWSGTCNILDYCGEYYEHGGDRAVEALVEDDGRAYRGWVEKK